MKKSLLREWFKGLVLTPIEYAIKAAVFLLIAPLVFSIILKGALHFSGTYLDLRSTIIEWGKLTHLDIKKRNTLKLEAGYSDSASCNYHMRWVETPQNMWFMIINPDLDVDYDNVRIFLTFDQPQRSMVSIDNGGGWVMFEGGRFNYGTVQRMLRATSSPTEHVRMFFKEKGTYVFQYSIHADNFNLSTGSCTVVLE